MIEDELVIEKEFEQEMRDFDEWFRINLNRSYSDRAILSVLQFHVLKSYVDSEISYGEMMKALKFQYENLFANRKALLERKAPECQATPT